MAMMCGDVMTYSDCLFKNFMSVW